jgi:hypothetical protein
MKNDFSDEQALRYAIYPRNLNSHENTDMCYCLNDSLDNISSNNIMFIQCNNYQQNK